jgi:hypothetical protein
LCQLRLCSTSHPRLRTSAEVPAHFGDSYALSAWRVRLTRLLITPDMRGWSVHSHLAMIRAHGCPSPLAPRPPRLDLPSPFRRPSSAARPANNVRSSLLLLTALLSQDVRSSLCYLLSLPTPSFSQKATPGGGRHPLSVVARPLSRPSPTPHTSILVHFQPIPSNPPGSVEFGSPGLLTGEWHRLFLPISKKSNRLKKAFGGFGDASDVTASRTKPFVRTLFLLAIKPSVSAEPGRTDKDTTL